MKFALLLAIIVPLWASSECRERMSDGRHSYRPADRPADHQHNWKATRGLAMGDEAVVRVACFSFVLAVAAEIAVEARQRELAVVRPIFGEGAVADRFSALVFNGEMNRSIAPEH